MEKRGAVMEASKAELRFKVSSDNKKVIDINEENWMLEYQTEGSFTNSIFIDIFKRLVNCNEYIYIGRLNSTYFKVDKIINKRASLFDVFDSIDQDIYMVYDALIDDDGYFNSDYCGMKSNVLYIERLYIEEAYRNQGLGEKILDQLDDVLNYSLNCEVGCYIVLPNPIEKSDKYSFEILDNSNLKKKLLKFYRKCGFNRIPNTEFMYINTDYKITKRDFELL